LSGESTDASDAIERLGRYVQRMMGRLQKARTRTLRSVVPAALSGLSERANAVEAHLFTVRTQSDGYSTGSLRYSSSGGKYSDLRRFPLQFLTTEVQERLQANQAVIITLPSSQVGGPLIEKIFSKTGCGVYYLCPLQFGGRLKGMLGVAAEDRDVFDSGICRLLRQGGVILYWGLQMIRRESKQRRRFREWKSIAAKACDLTLTLNESRMIVHAEAPGRTTSMRHLTGHPVTELVDYPFHTELARAIDRSQRDNVVHVISFRLSTGTAESRWYTARIDPDQTNAGGVILYLTDNHEDQSRQEEIRRLQTRVRETERQRLIGKMNTEFAHQLTQPMQSIRTQCNMLHRQVTQKRDTRETTLRVLDEVDKTIQHNKDITTSIRLFVQERRLQIDLVPIDDLLAQAFMLASPLARDHGALLVFPLEGSGLKVLADMVQTTHVMLNLIVNAVEACRDAGTPDPRIEVRTEPRGDSLLSVVVRDNGPGLPEDRQKELFREFQSDKIGGMGIGLTISRDICKAQHGELTASNNSDGPGCTFCFTLQLSGGTDNDTVEISPTGYPQ